MFALSFLYHAIKHAIVLALGTSITRPLSTYLPCIQKTHRWSDHEGLVPSKILDHTAANPRSRGSTLLWACPAHPRCTAPTSNSRHQKQHIAPSQRGEASRALSPHCYSGTSSHHQAALVVAPVHPVSTLLLWGPTAAADDRQHNALKNATQR
jgi:hypothetical protein